MKMYRRIYLEDNYLLSIAKSIYLLGIVNYILNKILKSINNAFFS